MSLKPLTQETAKRKNDPENGAFVFRGVFANLRSADLLYLLGMNMQGRVPVRVLSLNIEGSNHIDSVQELIRSKRPDVICLQEVRMPEFVARTFADVDGKRVYDQRFDAMGCHAGHIQGVATLWKERKCQNGAACYSQRDFDAARHSSLDADTYSRVLSWVRYGGIVVANTHFVWTPDGEPSDVQWREVKTLRRALAVLEARFGGFVCAGDFNAPRGRAVYAALLDGYLDHLPPSIDSTLDPQLHRTASKNLRLAVDTIFGTYPALEVETLGGVSDHLAILATIAPLQVSVK
jgi:endonuclease/exonuclease/phosphatase family metal-dependent hydrolase